MTCRDFKHSIFIVWKIFHKLKRGILKCEIEILKLIKLIKFWTQIWRNTSWLKKIIFLTTLVKYKAYTKVI